MAGSKRRKPTRRKPGEGTIRQRADGTWERRLCMGHDADDKAILKSFYGRTQDEAMAKAAQWLAEHPNGPPSPQQAAPFNDVLNAWLLAEVAPPFGKRGTLEDYASKIRLHIAPTLGKMASGKIRLHDINLWLRRLAESGKGRTTEKCLQIVHAAFAYAVKNGTLPSNPAEHAKAPDYERRKPQPLTITEVRAFLEAAAGRRDVRRGAAPIGVRLEALYTVLLYVGLRRGEVLALRWSDLNGAVLSVRRQVDRRGRELPYTKTDKSNRDIELVDEVLDAIAAHQGRMQAEPHDEARKPDGLIFPSREGTILNPSNLHRHFKTVLAAAGLPATVRIHDLRHTVGKTAEAAGAPIAAISALLGHANTAITQKLYGHGDEAGVKATIRKIGDKVRGEE